MDPNDDPDDDLDDDPDDDSHDDPFGDDDSNAATTGPDFSRDATVPGLFIARDALPATAQAAILAHIHHNHWFPAPPSQTQYILFGTSGITSIPCLHPLLHVASTLLHAAGLHPPTTTTAPCTHAVPAFNHLLANYYPRGTGIAAHTDLVRFHDGIIILSLQSSCVMRFQNLAGRPMQGYAAVPDDAQPLQVVDLLLCPGDVVCLSGQARWEWTHGIAAVESDVVAGVEVPRGERVSITLRMMDADGGGCV